MERIARIFTGLFLLLFLGGFTVFFSRKVEKLKPLQAAVLKIPEFSFVTLEGDKVATSDLDDDRKLIVQFISPSCELCNYETEEFKKHYGELKDVQVLFVSRDPKLEVVEFVKHQQLDKYPNIRVLHDPEQHAFRFAEFPGEPSTYIFDEHGLLVKKFRSEVKFEAIRPYIQSE